MSTELIDRWLDDEVDDENRTRLEEWLREDPGNLRSFFDAVRLQEDLRMHYGGNAESVSLPRRKYRGSLVIVGLSAIAALIVVTVFIAPAFLSPPGPDGPLVSVVSGNPRVEIVKVPPGPSPGPVPQEQWQVETRVTTAEEPGSLRWGERSLLEAGADAAFTLREATDRDESGEPRSIHLDQGTLTVKLEAPAVPVDIFVGDSRIRATRPAVFTLADPGPQPFSVAVVLTVMNGEVELRLPGDERRSVRAGEQVSIP
ncbi:MAG: hypothetical protein KDA83_04075 [Planctomycetales bacterium]|nr:hypothetical protein [Planctomycetales bacterium]